jgi:membrane protein
MGGLLNSIPGRVVQKFLDDRAPNWAVLIAWNGLFAMFPIVVFAAAVLGLVIGAFGGAAKVVYNGLLSGIPQGDARNAAADALNHFEKQKGILLLVGFIGLLWGGSALFGAMEQAFAVIYHTKPRDFVPQKLVGFAMVFLFIILGGSIVASSAILPALQSIPGVPSFLTHGIAAVVIQFVLGAISGFIFFATVYFVIPNRKQHWTRVLPGAVVAGVLFELTTLLFPVYIALTNSVASYGQEFGLFFVILTFFLFVGLITMVGVEINSVLFPFDVEHPTRGDVVAAAPKTVRAEDQWGPPQAEPSINGARGPVRKGIKTRTALLLAVGASVVGLLLGRRSAAGD